MNLVHQFALIPWALVAAFLSGNLVPYLSALVTRTRGWWTGLTSAALSFLAGFLAVLAQSGSPVHWRTVLGAAFGTWAVAALHHSKILSGTQIESALHGVGNAPPTPAD